MNFIHYISQQIIKLGNHIISYAHHYKILEKISLFKKIKPEYQQGLALQVKVIRDV
jgi:hypothetical protein